MIYLLDTNAVSDLVVNQLKVARNASERLVAGDSLGLCRLVYYELLRGLIWRNASGKLHTLRQRVMPIMEWAELAPSDYEQAAQFWADARRKGRQLGDPDLLLAALVLRLNAVLVSADADFDVLPIRREDWRA